LEVKEVRTEEGRRNEKVALDIGMGGVKSGKQKKGGGEKLGTGKKDAATKKGSPLQ